MKRKKLLTAVLSAIMMLSVAAVTTAVVHSSSIVAQAAEAVSINKTNLTLGVNETYNLTVSGAKVSKWTSSDISVADVSNGMVTAVSQGSAIISAELSNGNTMSCKVNVRSAPADVSLNVSAMTLGVGEKYTLKPKNVQPSNYAGSYSTESSDPSVATVTWSGVVTPKKPGTATITFKYYNGVKATCKVKVKNAPNSIKFSSASETIGVGEELQLKCDLNSGAASRIKVYSSSNSKVAEVAAAGGKVVAKGVGTAKITVETFNGKTATCTINVKKAPDSVSMNKTNLTLGVGETYQLKADVNSGAVSKTMVYSSSDDSVAEVAASGGKITAKSSGTAVITVKTFNGKTATCKVTVRSAPTNMTLNVTDMTLGVGEKYTLKPKNVQPSNYAGSYSTESSDPSVATVTWSGVVTPKKPGTATITFKYYNGVKATCKVKVKNAPTSIRFRRSEVKLSLGTIYPFYTDVNSGAASRIRTYTTSDNSVVDIYEGHFYAVGFGTATISVKTYNGKTTKMKVVVGEFEERLINLVNDFRISEGLEPVSLDFYLSFAAGIKAQDFLVNGYFDHYSPVYGYPSEMLEQLEIPWDVSYTLENIAYGYTTPEEVFDAWMSSQGHRNNILDPYVKKMGIGFCNMDYYSSDSQRYTWSQIFIDDDSQIEDYE